MDSPLTTQAALLWALGEGPAHGAELVSRLRTRTNGTITVPDGTLYPALRSLVETALAIELHEQGARRQFELTQAGKDRLDEARAVIESIFGQARKRKTRKSP